MTAIKRVAVLGSGAIGSSVAADIARAGYDLTVIDQWPAHVEAMRTSGLQVTIPDEEFTVVLDAVHLCDLCSLRRTFDLVFLACKSYDAAWMAQFIVPYLEPDGVVVPLQNSMSDDWVAPIVGRERDIGCAVELSAEVFTPGVLRRNTMRKITWFGLGELNGQITPRLEAVAQVLSSAGRVDLSTNIRGAKWAKLVNSSMILAPLGMLGMPGSQSIEIPEVFNLCIRLGRETLAVGAALGIEIEPIFGMGAQEFSGSTDSVLERLLRELFVAHGETTVRRMRGVISQDYLKRRRTETGNLNGLVSMRGREVGVPTPANDAIVEVLRRIEAGELKLDRSNIDVAYSVLGE